MAENVTITLTFQFTPEALEAASDTLGCEPAGLADAMAGEFLSCLEYDGGFSGGIPHEWSATTKGLPPPPPADVVAADHGSVVTLTPNTPEAQAWLRDHVAEDAQWLGGALAVEPRFLEPILGGLQEEGFTVDFAPLS